MMRMWMLNPKHMCRKHLLGEHVEIHMFLGTLKKGVSVGGYIQNNLLEPNSLFSRHEQLKEEMLSRGYLHKSELDKVELEICLKRMNENFLNYKIDTNLSANDLYNRCEECKKRKG